LEKKSWKYPTAQTATFRLLDVFCPSDRDRWYRLKARTKLLA
jgi:hypothetical protein